nr:8-amino-7-oxononanoate synthase [Kofleriaceae bacterium]
MSLDDDAQAELAALAAAGRLRVPRIVDGVGPVIRVDGREVINASSNDYLGLAGDPRLVAAATAELATGVVGAAASRLVTGNHRRIAELELAVAAWLGVGGVRVFGSGYAANVGVISALAGDGDLVVSDALNHASIIDGCRLSRARVAVVPHLDVDAFAHALRADARRRFVISESMFSMDGDLADVVALRELCDRAGATLIVDEAHAVGAWGPDGRGVCAARGVVPDLLVGTFGKSLGSSGAFAASTRSVADLLWNRARSLVFSTAMLPAAAAAAVAAIEIVRNPDGLARRDRLARNAHRLRERVPRLGGAGAILPLVVGDDREAVALSERVLAAGVLAQAIRPPTVPVGTSRLRVSVSSEHSDEQLDRIGAALHGA